MSKINEVWAGESYPVNAGRYAIWIDIGILPHRVHYRTNGIWDGGNFEPIPDDLPAYFCIDFSNATLKSLDNPTIEYQFVRNSIATVKDFEGIIRTCKVAEARFEDARRVENLATGLVTKTITVKDGNDYQVTINGTAGATATCSGAFTGTLNANGTNRISWNNGVPKASTGTSLTITVVGTLTELQVENITGQSNQNPGDYVSNGLGEDHGCNVDGVQYFAYTNPNIVDENGIVTEDKAGTIFNVSYLNESSSKNLFLNSDVPVTQTITPPIGMHTCWLNGTGSITLSGGLTGVVTNGSPVKGDPIGVDVICTISGDITRVQFEQQPTATSYIPTSGTAITRVADNLSYTNVNVHQDFVVAVDVTPIRVE